VVVENLDAASAERVSYLEWMSGEVEYLPHRRGGGPTVGISGAEAESHGRLRPITIQRD